MKLTKDFWRDTRAGEDVCEYRVDIEGRILKAGYASPIGTVRPPTYMEHVDRILRRQIMNALEVAIFGGRV